MTRSEIIRVLREAGIDSAAYEAGLLIERFENVKPTEILASPFRDYTSEALTDAVKKRSERYPLQYILGEWEFMGLTFSVGEDSLIPRADTEITAEAAIEFFREKRTNGGTLLDLCTGTGCIAAAVLSYTDNTTGYAVELYHDTALRARENLSRLGLGERCAVIEGDATKPLFEDGVKFDVITANPPYVTPEEMEALEPELYHEPERALTDGCDGLEIIRGIISEYADRLTDGGVMIIEHGSSQAQAVQKIANEHGLASETLYDLAGLERAQRITKV